MHTQTLTVHYFISIYETYPIKTIMPTFIATSYALRYTRKSCYTYKLRYRQNFTRAQLKPTNQLVEQQCVTATDDPDAAAKTLYLSVCLCVSI